MFTSLTACSRAIWAAPLLFIVFFATSCKKKADDDPTKGFTTKIQNIIPQTVIEDLRSKGMTINEGKVPPKLLTNSAYLASPYEMLSPYGPEDSWQKGKIINDYKYQFYDQTDAGDIKYDFTNNASDKGNGKGAFIAGNANKFTIFSQDEGVASSVPYKTLAVISGELTATGIKDFQYAFVMKEKTGDNDNKTLIGVGKARVWIDKDQLATLTSRFRMAAQLTSGVSAKSSR